MSPKYGGRGSFKIFNKMLGILKSGFIDIIDPLTKKVIRQEFREGQKLVSPEGFMSLVYRTVEQLFDAREVFKINNTVLLNLSAGTSNEEKIAGRADIMAINEFGAEGYNMEVVDNIKADAGLGVPRMEEIDLKIGEETYKVNVFTYSSYSKKLIQVLISGEDRKKIQMHAKGDYKKFILAKVAVSLINKDKSKRYIIKTDSTEFFEDDADIDESFIDRTAFSVKETRGSDVRFGTTALQPELTDLMVKSWHRNSVVSLVKLPILSAIYNDAINNTIRESGLNVQTLGNMLSAA
jgi:hypothetical protein